MKIAQIKISLLALMLSACANHPTQLIVSPEFTNPLTKVYQEQQASLSQQLGRYVPMAVKVAPDLDAGEVEQLAESFNQYEIDARVTVGVSFSNKNNKLEENKWERKQLKQRQILRLRSVN